MEIPSVTEKWSGKVGEVTIGATKEEGGTREKVIKVGGAGSVPCMDFEGSPGNKPVIAMDVLDIPPADWPEPLMEHYKDVAGDPAKWAEKCVKEFGADLICLKLDGVHPDRGNRSPDDAAKTARSVLEAVGVPLIIWGCDDPNKDNEVMPKVSEATKGERCLNFDHLINPEHRRFFIVNKIHGDLNLPAFFYLKTHGFNISKSALCMPDGIRDIFGYL